MEKDSKNTFIESITPETANLVSSLGEVALDNLNLVDGVLKEIPIISSIISAGKLGFTINNILFLNKFMTFIKSSENIKNSQAFDSFREKISDPKQKEKISNHLLELIDKTIVEEKIKIYSKLFDKFVKNEINWERFYILTLTVYDLHILGIEFLKELLKDFDLKKTKGVPRDYREGYLSTAGLSQRNGAQIKISDLGKELFEFGIKD